MKPKLFFIIGLLFFFLPHSVYATGSLNVVSTPEGADIYINGITTGETTPHIFSNLSSYDFMGGGFAYCLVTLRKDGYPKPGFAMGMGIEGTTSTVTIDFNALYSGSFIITSDPDGAEIYLDGAPTGEVTPHTFNDISVYIPAQGGILYDHLITVRKDGYPQPGIEFCSVTDTTNSIHVNFRDDPVGTVTVESNPSGAEIYLDFAPTAKITPYTFTDLSVSTSHNVHYFSVKKDGYNLTGFRGDILYEGTPQTYTFNDLDDTAPTGTPTTPTDEGDFSDATITFTWTQGTADDPETGIAGYYLQVSENTDFTTNLFDADVGDTLTKTVQGAEHGKTYYARVRAKNGAAIYGDWSGNSDGVTVDATPPTLDEVRDGTGFDIDYTTSTVELSANWDSAVDPESGITKYYYSIGLSPNTTGTVDWTDAGTSTYVTKSGLSLSEGATYYFTVKAVNGAGTEAPLVTPEGYQEELITNEFIGGGVAQGWHADSSSWLYSLPFPFKFYGTEYTSVYVCSNGFLDFTSNMPWCYGENELKSRVVIAPLSADLATYGPGEDIFIHQPSADSVCIRWCAESDMDGSPVNFEVVLYESGDIKFNYGSGNNNIFPTVGISAGNNTDYVISTYNEAFSLENVQTSKMRFVPALYGLSTDGQMVFTSGDSTPPTGTPTAPVDEGNFSDATITFNWTQGTADDPESGIAGYYLQVSTSTGFETNLFDADVGDVLTKDITGCTAGKTYYARVRAKNSFGLYSNWSGNSDGVTIDISPPTGTPSTPVDEGDFSDATIIFNWTQGSASDPESGISGYYVQVSTSTGFETNIFNNYVGDVLSINVSGCQNGKTYYAQVRARNAAGFYSNYSNSSDGITVDITPPIMMGAVRDGEVGEDIDYTGSTTTISANWDEADDPESGIAKYYYAVGLSPGATEIADWTDVGLSTYVTKTGLSLSTGTLCYFTVIAENNAGLKSQPTGGDYQEILINNEFIGGGTGRGWQGGDVPGYLYTLPFSFPFYGNNYTSVYVHTKGFLDFTSNALDYSPSIAELKQRIMIAPLWNDLRTNGTSQPNEDIYIHQLSGDSVCIRWCGETWGGGDPVNFEAVLYQSGNIKLNYGSGNDFSSFMPPTVGISAGNDTDYVISTYNNASSLENEKTSNMIPSGGNSSDGQLVVIDISPPVGVPGTPADEGNFSDATITFNWTQGTANDPESGIAGYYLQVSTSTGFETNLFDDDVGNVLTKDVAGAENGKTYYARVKAGNGAGMYSGWSGISDGITVDTEAPTGAPSVPVDTGVYSSSSTITFNWTQGTADDPESGIAGYYLQVSTSTGFETNLFDADVGNKLTTDVGGAEHGKTYYAHVRAINGAGLYSNYSGISDGITIDLTPPKTTGISDGTGIDIDYTTVNDTLSANWNDAIDSESSIVKYYYAIGLTPGTTNKVDWTDVGFSTYVIKSGLSLTDGVTYYFTVKAVNGAGMESSISTGEYQETLINSEFIGGGVAQGWHADDNSWSYSLPFPFKYYGTEYTSVYICSNGFLNFTYNDSSCGNSIPDLMARVMIASLWDDLRTDGPGQDIFIHQPSGDSVCIRWCGETYSNGDPVNFEVVLHQDGNIKFNYGSGNTNLSATVGISAGNNTDYLISAHNDLSSLDSAQTSEIIFIPPSYTDGQMVDSTPPTGAPDTPGDEGDYGDSVLDFNWSTGTVVELESGLAGYHLQVCENTDFLTNFFDDEVGNVLSKNIGGAEQGKTYYARVRAKNNAELYSSWSGTSDGIIIDTSAPLGVPTDPVDTGVYATTTTLTFNWTQGTASDPETGIAGYYLQVSTSTGFETNLFDSYVGDILTKDVGGAENGKTYYARVVAKNNAGMYGSWSGASDGITVDITPPLVGKVRDGAGMVDIDYTTSTVTLSANWDEAVDSESGVLKYYYAVGTSPEGDNVVNWTDIGISTYVTKTGLNLENGVTYYFTLKVENAVGLVSTFAGMHYEQLLDNEFVGGGVAQFWQGNDVPGYSYSLPFSFPFYGTGYNSVYVHTKGFLDFTSDTSDYENTLEKLKNKVMIAALWDDLKTNGTAQSNEDIYIHQPSPDSVCIRWCGETVGLNYPVNFEAVLYENGDITFNYASGNTNLTPTIGISAGDNINYIVSAYDNSSSLTDVQTSKIELIYPYSDGVTVDTTSPTGTPSTPADEGDYSDSTLTFDWTQGTANDSESSIAGYYLQVSTDTGFEVNLFDEDVGNVLMKDVPGAENGKTYYARVCAKNGVEMYTNWSGTSDGIFTDTSPPVGMPSVPVDTGIYATSTTLTFNWTQGTADDPESGIAGYYLQISTSTGFEVNLFDEDVGNVLTKDVEGAENGKTYYARVRAKNLPGMYSNWSGASDGITVDVTPPLISEVRDGLGMTDIDYITSTSTLSANWDEVSDPESGVLTCYYAVGLSPGTTETADWTDIGLSTYTTLSDLSLNNGITYYFTVKAENNAGLQETTSSDGVIVDTTPPTGIPGTPTDEGDYSDSTLTFDWTQGTADDPESGIAGYYLQVSTSVPGFEVNLFDADVGNVLTKDVSGAEFGKTYYARVRARNGVWMYTEWWSGISDGIITDDTPPSEPVPVFDGAEYGIDIGLAGSTTTLSANWGPSTDDESGIARYWYAIGNFPGGTDVADWTDVGISTSITRTGLELTNWSMYFFVVRAENVAGLLSNPVFSNGQIADIPIAPGFVDDGLGADIAYTGSTVQLSANWDPGFDPYSPIVRYWIAIGTTPGGTEVLDWKDNGLNISTTTTGLNLDNEETYYFTVKAENNIGGLSAPTNSNGQTVDNTPPDTISEVRDGTGLDIAYTGSTDELWANWDASSDAQSGIARYWVAVGTTPGGIDVQGWKDNGLSLITVASGLFVNGTTYYFTVRAENNAGIYSTPTNSNGQIVDTTPPDAISEVRDGTGVDMDSTSLTTQLSANWDVSNDPESGISKYLYAIGTTQGGTDIAPWTDNSTSTDVTHTGLSLTVGPTYYFTVKAVNGAGLESNPTNSNGQWVDDITPPDDIVEVRDGTSWLLRIDKDFTTSSTTLSANWDASSDGESGIAKYWYGIGITQGTTNIVDWTDNGPSTMVTRKGLSLTVGTTYYFTVKAENGTGLESNPTNSDGQWVKSAEVAVLSLNTTTLDFDKVDKDRTKVSSFTITNTGEGTLSGTISDDREWITVNPTSFNGNNTKIYVLVDNKVLGKREGQYAGTVSITSNGGNAEVIVEVTATCVFTRPNPYNPRGGRKLTFFGSGVANGTIKIYTLAGELVRTLKEENGNKTIEWNGRNESGDEVISGIYLYTTESDKEKNACSFTIIKK